MKKNNYILLKRISQYPETEGVSLILLDRWVIKNYPELIENNEFISILNELADNHLIEIVDKRLALITKIGQDTMLEWAT